MKENFEQFKRLLRTLFSASLILGQAAVFAYYWLNYYNEMIILPFVRKGSVMMVVLYTVFLFVFLKFFEGFKFGIQKKVSMSISQVLAALTTNFITYLQIVLMSTRFVTVVPMLWALLFDIIFAIAITFFADFVFHKCFPARKALLIYNDYEPSAFIKKVSTRKDKYIIDKVLNVSVGMETLEKEIEKAESVIIYDVHSEARNKILKLCFRYNVRTYTTTKVSDVLIRGAESLHLFDSPLLLYRNSNLSIEQRFVKRSMDIIISLLLLILTSPIFIISAIAIKLYDGGPVFFRQKRTTINGKEFMIHKFRSMVVDAEKGDKPIPATNKDPRITPVGRVLRFCRMDELPQIIDILVGNMSLVGPRPERVEHTEKYTKMLPEFEYRLKVRAGLTGYAQLYGKYNTSPYDKLQLDLMYIQNYSLLLDIQLLFMTIKILFMKESTEGFEEK